jgi:hypothetical protein
MKSKLQLAFAGPDLSAVLRELRARNLPHPGDPDKIITDGKARKVGAKWLEQGSNCKTSFMAMWTGGWLSLDRDTIVKLSISDFEIAPSWLLELIESLPVTLISNNTVFPEWRDGSLGKEYLPPGFADLHWSHGAFCAFKGAGHDRLVSRRWLDFGPWRLVRGKNDTSLVQFHDLDVDAKTALAQARVAHARMGISPTGGFFQKPFHYEHKLKGRYLPGLRKLDFVVNGREISESEMLDAAATRHEQALGPDQPIDSVAYTFVVEEEAHAHLHELWLRELECWAIIKGKELRLDTDYRPGAAPPDWVKRPSP